MDADQLWKEYSSLTPEEQQTAKSQHEGQQIAWDKDPFIGMWRDWDDMSDGARWIRDLRDREYSRHHR
jgi:hypothetical protein